MAAGVGRAGHLAQRAECLLRTLPKDLRVFLQPISQKAAYFAELRHGLEPDGPLARKLAEFVEAETGRFCAPSFFDMNRLPAELVTKVWVCDDEGEELAMGTDIAELNGRLDKKLSRRFRETAGGHRIRDRHEGMELRKFGAYGECGGKAGLCGPGG